MYLSLSPTEDLLEGVTDLQDGYDDDDDLVLLSRCFDGQDNDLGTYVIVGVSIVGRQNGIMMLSHMVTTNVNGKQVKECCTICYKITLSTLLDQ